MLAFPAPIRERQRHVQLRMHVRYDANAPSPTTADRAQPRSRWLAARRRTRPPRTAPPSPSPRMTPTMTMRERAWPHPLGESCRGAGPGSSQSTSSGTPNRRMYRQPQACRTVPASAKTTRLATTRRGPSPARRPCHCSTLIGRVSCRTIHLRVASAAVGSTTCVTSDIRSSSELATGSATSKYISSPHWATRCPSWRRAWRCQSSTPKRGALTVSTTPRRVSSSVQTPGCDSVADGATSDPRSTGASCRAR